jgi:hypothetical protein
MFSASTNPLAIPQEDFEQMYEDNKDLWGDCNKKVGLLLPNCHGLMQPSWQEAYVNYMRSQSGNVDSAR